MVIGVIFWTHRKIQVSNFIHFTVGELKDNVKISWTVIPSSDDSTCFDKKDLRQGNGIPEPTATNPAEKRKNALLSHQQKPFDKTLKFDKRR